LVIYIPTVKNTGGAMTVAKNGGAAQSVKRMDGTDPLPGDFDTTVAAILLYDGTNYRYLNAPDSHVINRKTSATNVANTVVETDAYTFTVPANTIGTTRKLRLSVEGTALNNTGGAVNLILTFYYGSTKIAQATTSIAASGNALNFVGLAEVMALGATNVQAGLGGFAFPNYTTSLAAAAITEYVARNYSMAEDSTAALALKMTAQWGVASANASFSCTNATLEIL
jgi:hypothetical protein